MSFVEGGKVFCWGLNRHGQCGLDPKSHPNVCKPSNIGGLLENVKVSQIYSGWSHILAKTGKSLLYFLLQNYHIGFWIREICTMSNI